MEEKGIKKLTDWKESGQVLLQSFTNSEVASRLMAMGLLPGASLEIKRIAPFKGGYCIKTKKQTIALRYSEAAALLVTALAANSAA